MEVLKCQRPPKSSVMRRMVWWSLRWSLRSAGERTGSKGSFDCGSQNRRTFAQDDTVINRRYFVGKGSFDSAPCGRSAQDDPTGGFVARWYVAGYVAVDAGEEAADAFDAGVLPVEIAVGRRGEERVHAGGVGAVFRDHVVGRDDVAEALRHFRAVLDDHALGEQALGRLVVFHESDVAHELGPEARVDEVQDGVFGSADVLVDGEPIIHGVHVEGRGVDRRDWCSDRSTRTNRRKCPWCRFRGARGLRTSGKWC